MRITQFFWDINSKGACFMESYGLNHADEFLPLIFRLKEKINVFRFVFILRGEKTPTLLVGRWEMNRQSYLLPLNI